MKMKIARWTLFIIVVWLTIHLGYTTIDGLTDSHKPADIALILGTKVNKDGTLSARLAKRLDCAIDLYKTARVNKFITSGGLGKEGFYEGDKMKEYLVKNGIPDSLIIVDNHGDNTLKSVQNTLKLKDSLHFNKVIIVSQFYHLTRSKMLFRKSGFSNVDSISPRYFELRDIYSLLREFVAFYAELI